MKLSKEERVEQGLKVSELRSKITVARYKKGIMSREQVLNYIKVGFSAKADSEAIKYIMSNL